MSFCCSGVRMSLSAICAGSAPVCCATFSTRDVKCFSAHVSYIPSGKFQNMNATSGFLIASMLKLSNAQRRNTSLSCAIISENVCFSLTVSLIAGFCVDLFLSAGTFYNLHSHEVVRFCVAFVVIRCLWGAAWGLWVACCRIAYHASARGFPAHLHPSALSTGVVPQSAVVVR